MLGIIDPGKQKIRAPTRYYFYFDDDYCSAWKQATYKGVGALFGVSNNLSGSMNCGGGGSNRHEPKNGKNELLNTRSSRQDDHDKHEKREASLVAT